ncbi:MAG: LPXTG cell wall anchor domain-containing protein [Actinomycetota bacterium]
MTATTNTDGSGDDALALTDFALDEPPSDLRSTIAESVARIRGGELGSIPALLAIAVLVSVFGAVNPGSFLSAVNLANFLEQASSVIVIAMAVSFALLLGEIDLAAGFTAGVSAAVLATRLQEWPLLPSVLAAALVAIALGLFTGFMVARIGIPSFVVTLANVLLFQGILLLLVREGGSVRIEDPVVKDLVGANLSTTASWVFAIGCVLAYLGLQIRRQRSTHQRRPWSVIGVKVGLLAAGLVTLTLILNGNRAFPNAPAPIQGLPIVIPAVLALVVVLNLLLNRTRFGRHLYAVGGNAEAARRAGIDVMRIRLAAFTICGLLAGIGGAFLASRVNSVDPNTGANDTLLLAVGAAVIGGTSLFGGRGRMMNAVLGGFVLALIPNGLTLVGKRMVPLLGEIDFGSSGVKFICAGAALLLASSVDALSRRQST